MQPLKQLVGTVQLVGSRRNYNGRILPPYTAVAILGITATRIRVRPIAGTPHAGVISIRLLLTPDDRRLLEIESVGYHSPVDAADPGCSP